MKNHQLNPRPIPRSTTQSTPRSTPRSTPQGAPWARQGWASALALAPLALALGCATPSQEGPQPVWASGTPAQAAPLTHRVDPTSTSTPTTECHGSPFVETCCYTLAPAVGTKNRSSLRYKPAHQPARVWATRRSPVDELPLLEEPSVAEMLTDGPQDPATSGSWTGMLSSEDGPAAVAGYRFDF